MFSLRRLLTRLFGARIGGVFYIGGAVSLPKPLDAEREHELLSLLRTAQGEQAKSVRAELIEHNLRLVAFIAKRFENTGVGTEDLISIGTLGLMKAVGTFDPSKHIRLATYASRCVENEILMYLRKTSCTRSDVSLEEPLNIDREGNELSVGETLGTDEDTVSRDLEQHEERTMIRQAVEALPPRSRAIIRMRFGFDSPDGTEMTQKEVADVLGISQSYISRLEKRILSGMKKELLRFYR